ncbi:unnamed protein product [Prunus armeniaca]
MQVEVLGNVQFTGETLLKFWQKVSCPKSSLVKGDIVLRSEPGVGVMPGSPQGSSRVSGNSGRVLSLSLMQQAGMASLFDTNHQIFVMLIVALTVYGLTIIGSTYILDTPPEFVKFVNTLSLSFGALTIILELMILVPNLGSVALLVWLFWVVSFVAVYLYRNVKELSKTSAELFKRAVGGIVDACQNLINYLKNKISPNEE